MAKTKSNPYIALVCATEDEIKTEYSEIIEGQIIFDTTNKIIYRDEVGRRIAYTGKQVQPSVCQNVDNLVAGGAGKLKFATNHPRGTVFYANDILYEAKVDIKKGDILSDTNSKQTSVMNKVSDLDDKINTKVSELNNKIDTKVGELDNKIGAKISKNQLTFDIVGTDLYITKNY